MRVFYSFSLKHDIGMANELAAELRSLDEYEPIIPIDGPIRVHNWRYRLAEALRKSDVAVVLLTPHGLNSPYVVGELWAARMLSQINRRFVLVPVLWKRKSIPEFASDLFIANARGRIDTIPELAREIHMIVKDNIRFELAISDLKPRIFIGHGRSDHWRRIDEFLRDSLGLEAEEYDTTSPIGRTVTARLEEMLSVSSFAIIVMSAEDEQLDGKLRARQNVIHEAGLFQGRLGFEKVAILRQTGCGTFSNVSGINEIEYDATDWAVAYLKIRHALEREGLVRRLDLTKASSSIQRP